MPKSIRAFQALREKTFQKIGYLIAKHYLKNEQLSYLMGTRFFHFSSLFKEIINQLLFVLRIPRVVFPPTSLAFELTNHCNLHCDMCSQPSVMTRDKTFLDFDLYKRVIDENPQLDRVVFTNYGETLLHPRIWDFVRYAKSKNIHASFTTNGTLLDKKDHMKQALESGLDIIRFSMEGIDDAYARTRDYDYEKLKKNMLRFLEQREKYRSPVLVEISSVLTPGASDEELDKLQKFWGPKLDFINFLSMQVVDGRPRKNPCRELWRSFIVLCNGKVVPCCLDYDGVLSVGDLHQTTIREIINSPELVKLRKLHLAGKFTSLCGNCDEYFNWKYTGPRYRTESAPFVPGSE